jgi:EmrB/QacA subfamily drug resistance transporter
MDRKWWTLIVVCVATFMLLLDITIVNVALPSIQTALHANFQDLQWVVDAYSLTLAALLLTAGSLADLLGRKRVFTLGLAVFTGASLMCGLSGRPLVLNLARGVQGIGGAMMLATSLALIAQEFHGRERGTAYGIWGATVSAAAAIGPMIGGGLTQGLGWEYIFFINLPIGVAAIVLSITRLRDTRDPDATGVDWAGLITFSGGLFLLVLALIRGNDAGWSSTQIVAELAGAGALLLLFVVVEVRQRRPMLDLTLFRKPTFTGAAIAAFAVSSSLFALFLYLTLYFQNVLGYTPVQTGLRFLPLTVVAFFIAPLGGRLAGRAPARILMGGGLALVAVALLLMHGISVNSTWTELLAGFALAGVGLGILNPILAQTAVGVVPPARSGMASGVNNTGRQVGVATGIAALGALFQHQVQTRAAALLAGTPAAGFVSGHGAAVAQQLSSGGGAGSASAPPAVRQQLAMVGKQAFVSGFNEIVIVGAIIAAVGAVLAFVLVRQSDFVASAPAAQAAAEAAA